MFLVFKNGVKSIQTAGYNGKWQTKTVGNDRWERNKFVGLYAAFFITLLVFHYIGTWAREHACC